GADSQYRSVHVLSPRPPIYAATLEIELPIGPPDVRQRGRIGSALCTRLRRHRRLRFFPVPALPFGSGDRHYPGDRCESAGFGRPTCRSACFARARAVTWATIRGSNGGIRKGNRAGPKFLRGPLFLRPCLRHAGEAGTGGHAFLAGGRKQARRLSIIVPADSRLPVIGPAEG